MNADTNGNKIEPLTKLYSQLIINSTEDITQRLQRLKVNKRRNKNNKTPITDNKLKELIANILMS